MSPMAALIGPQPIGRASPGPSATPTRGRSATLHLPDGTKHARIVLVIVGPIPRLQLRHVPSDWVLRRMVVGCDVAESVERFRQSAERHGHRVGRGHTVEDWNPRIAGRCGREGAVRRGDTIVGEIAFERW
jgi:hypothetical protein